VPGDRLQADRPRSAPRPPKPLKARAIALLARREYSRTELRDKLAAGGERDADGMTAVDAVLDELAALGFLSDDRFAKSVVRQKSGGYSKRAIGAALKAKGVSGDAASEALASADIDDQAALVALWRRRFGKPPADDREMARQARFLQGRGFSLSAIFKLLRDPPGDGGASGP
jgi:regulatory protein